MKRYLITTADERSWKLDQPAIFLGEWCRLYDRRAIWSNMDAIVSEPFQLKGQERDKAIRYLRAFSDDLLKELNIGLNQLHGVHHTERYWRILLGHWIFRCVCTLYNRYHVIEQVIRLHDISGTTVFDLPAHSFVTSNTEDFIWATANDEWNNLLYAKIISLHPNIPLEKKDISSPASKASLQKGHPPLSRIIKTGLRDSFATVLRKFAKQTDAFIANSYLPQSKELLLNLSLKQIPQLYTRPTFQSRASSPSDRSSLIKKKEGKDFESFARSIFCDLIPSCFVEDFKSLTDESNQVPWPKKPKFIFTSNCFDTDEIFKVWAASKVENGSAYFAGQHGNNFGTTLYYSEQPEFATSDAYLTWGWKHDQYSMVPTFVFKTAGLKQGKWDSHGHLLLIEDLAPHFFGPFDSYYEFGLYQESQFQFVRSLGDQIKRRLIVRLHQANQKFRWSDRQRWQDFDATINLETGRVKIQKLIAGSRLVVHSYDSTGILETLSLNIPTLCFWRGGFDHLLDEAKPAYESLKDAGIYFEKPEQVAEHIRKHWNSIEEWWGSPKIQQAREAFCAQYARYERRPVTTLKAFFLKQLEERRA